MSPFGGRTSLHPFARRAAFYLKERGLNADGVRVLIALSGGPDSCALALALCEAADAGLLPVPCAVAHFHHGLRGIDADEDAAFSAALAVRLGLPCIVGIGAIQPGDGLSPNDAARRIRYAFLEDTARERGADSIVTAHTRDDQAETVLMRVLRGAGVEGLAGIPTSRPLGEGVTVIRPLLWATRTEVEDYCHARGITPRQDPSNQKARYARARLRALLPELARDFNPRLPEALNRLAENAARDADLLGSLANHLWKEASLVPGPDTVHLRRPVLHQAHPALRRRVLLHALRYAAGSAPSNAENAATDAFVTLLEGWLSPEVVSSADLPGGIRASVKGEFLILRREQKDLGSGSGTSYEIPLVVPGQTKVDQAGIILEAAWVDPGAVIRRERRSPVVDFSFPPGVPLTVRSTRAGDRLTPLGMAGKTRLVRDLLADAGIPSAERDHHPLVTRSDTGEVLWVVGIAQAESTRVHPGSESILQLRCSPIEPTSEQLTLSKLLSEVTPANLHGETDDGSSAGAEAW